MFDGLPVSARALRVLNVLGLTAWSDVATRDPMEFLRVPDCGVLTLREIGANLDTRAENPSPPGLRLAGWAAVAASARP